MNTTNRHKPRRTSDEAVRRATAADAHGRLRAGARGLPEPRGNHKGTFAVTASATVGVSFKQLFDAFTDPALRERWLPGAGVREGTSQPGLSARFAWEGGDTRVNLGFTAKGKGTSQVALRHERLPNAKAAARMKAYWRERLVVLKALMKR